MGLATAPSVFKRFINAALTPFLEPFVPVYADDTIAPQQSEEEHARHVGQVLESLAGADFHWKTGKFVSGVPLSRSWDCRLHRRGRHMCRDKVLKISSLAVSRNVQETP